MPPFEILVVSQGFEALTGLPESEFVGHGGERLREIIHPDDQKTATATLYNALLNGRIARDEYRTIHADGSIRWIAERAQTAFDDDGSPRWIDLHLLDITEFKRAQSELIESERRYRDIFVESPAPICEDDWSGVKRRLDEIASSGVTDWPAYFAEHREILAELYELARIVDVSQSYAEIYDMPSPAAFISDDAERLPSDADLDSLQAEITAFLAGQWVVDCERTDETLIGRRVGLRERVIIPSDGRKDWSRVLHTVFDVTEQRRAEMALGESEERYHDIFVDSPVAIWIEDWRTVKIRLDELAGAGIADWADLFQRNRALLNELYMATTVVDVSEAAVQLYGAPSAEVLMAYTDTSAEDPEDLDIFGDTLVALLNGEKLHTVEFSDQVYRAEPIIVRERVTIPERNRHDWSRVIYAIEDVTEQRQAEAALRDSERHYHEIFHASQAALWEEDWSAVKQRIDELAAAGTTDWPAFLDANPGDLRHLFELANIVEVSQAAAKLYDALSVEQLKRDAEDADRARGDLETLRDTILQFLDGRNAAILEILNDTYDGREILVRQRVGMPEENADDWSRVLYTLEDVTGQRQTERELRESEAKYRSLVENLPGAVLREVPDETGTFLFVSEGIVEITGRAADSLIGTEHKDLVHPDDWNQVNEQFRASVDKDVPFNAEYRMRHADDSYRWVRETIRILPDETGQPAYADGVIIDVTDLKEAQAVLGTSEARHREIFH